VVLALDAPPSSDENGGENTVELPWASRAPLLDRLREHDAGLQVMLAFEAVGSRCPFA
jgi:hypothetical protein